MESLVKYQVASELITQDDTQTLQKFSLMADSIVSGNAFMQYQSRKSDNTNRRHKAELETLRQFVQLSGVTLEPDTFYNDPTSWQYITHGVVEAFVQWLLRGGYEVNTINVRLSTIKQYVTLAYKAGVVTDYQRLLIKDVTAISKRERANINTKRETKRIGSKKETPTILRKMQVLQLKELAGDKPSDYRDTLLMQIFLNHGLRVSEVEILKVGNINLDTGIMTFTRPKMQGYKQQTGTHRLSSEILHTLKVYLTMIPNATPDSFLIRSSNKSGRLLNTGMSLRAIGKRVEELGNRLGIEHLSPHDLRHDVITDAAQLNDVVSVRDLGGWTNLNRVLDYINDKAVDNDNIKLSR